MVHFHAGEHLDVQPVDFRAVHVDPVDTWHGSVASQVPRCGSLTGLLRVDAIEIPDARHEPHVVGPKLEFGTGGGEQVAVTGRVDYLFGQDRLAARLALEDGSGNGVAVPRWRRRPSNEAAR